MNVHSDRLTLIPCTRELIQIILNGDEAIAQELSINIAKPWSEFGSEMFDYSLKMIETDARNEQWGAFLVIHKDSNTLIGTCGYKGRPDDEDRVEIGYEIAASFRMNSLATEVANVLVSHAFKSGCVNEVIAHTLPEKNASTKVLEKNGFNFEQIIEDPDDGVIWRWKLVRAENE